MHLIAEQARAQTELINQSALAPIIAVAERIAEQNAATFASFEPIGARWSNQIAASINAVQESIGPWPPTGIVASLSVLGEQSKFLNDSVFENLVSAQLDIAAKVEAVYRDVDFDVVSKMVNLDVAHLAALLDDDEADSGGDTVVDELTEELQTDRERVENARAVLRAVIGMVVNSLSDSTDWAVDAVERFDDAVHALHDAHGDNPYVWLVSTVLTAVTLWQIAARRASATQQSQDVETDD